MKRLFILLTILTLDIYAQKIYATFDIHADKNAHLAFNSGGTVSAVLTDVAMLVKKGDTLAELNSDDITANLNIAKVALSHAESNYNRQLLVKDIIQESKLELYKFQYDSAKAQVAYIQTMLNKTTLKAPFDGIITSKKVEVGDVVSAAMLRTVFEIQSERKRKLILEFDQKYWASVETGNSFSYTIDGEEKVHHGVITKIYPKANSRNRKMIAEVYAEDLIVGLFGTGYIQTQDEDGK